MSARTGEKLVIRLENAITAGENRLYPSAEAYRADLRAIAAQIAEHDRSQRREIQRLHMELESAGAITPDELAERYMELPVDIDGVPIRDDDMVEVPNAGGGTYRVLAVARDYWIDFNGCPHKPEQTIHVKPRTIEDVLGEYAFKMHDAYNDPTIGGEDREDVLSMIPDDYAAELRELMGGAE